MSAAPRQLPLPIAPRPSYGEEDFLVSPSNEAAFSLMARWPDWPDRTLLLIGPKGAGKTHLGAIWARRVAALVLPAATLRTGLAATLSPGCHVLVEDVDRGVDATALFHLLNQVHETAATLVVTARRPPETWTTLSDLVSRLRRAVRAEIGAPDDDLIRAVLVKLFVERQLLVDAGVVDFLARRLERSLDAAQEAVRRLDAEALAQGRRVSRAFAARILAETTGQENER